MATEMPQPAAPSAKVIPPRLARVAERPRLSALLDGASTRAAIWVSAQGGAGKTTAVATWLARRKLPAVWFNVDGGDNDPASFFYFLELAHRQAHRRKPARFPVFAMESANDLAAFTRRWCRAALARGRAELAWVFDNVHELAPQSPVNLVLATLCEEFRAAAPIVFLSRADPPPAFARLVAYGHLEQIGQEAMAFDEHEMAAALLARGLTAARNPEELRAASGGWITGAILMCMQGGRWHGAQAQPSGAGEHLFAYFAGEAFEGLDAADRTLLLNTAFLPDVSPSTACALSGDERAGDRLERLAQRNLFTEKRAGASPRYRYHDLFREFLRHRAAERLAPEELVRLKLLTASLLSSADEAAGAIALLLECEAWAEASAAILRHVEDMLASRRHETVVGWLRALPADPLHRDPWLLFWLGQSLLYADDSQARGWLEKAYDGFVARDEAVGRFVCAISIPVAMNTGHGTFDGLPEWIARIHADESRFDTFPSPFLELKCVGAQLYAAQLSDQLGTRVPQLCARVLALAPLVPDPNLQLHSLAQVVQFGWRMRQSDHAPEAIHLVQRLGLVERASPLVVIRWLNDYVSYESAHGSIETARNAADSGVELARDLHLPHAMFDAVLIRTEPAGDAGDAEEYGEVARELARHVDPSWPFSRAANHSIQGRLALLRGDGDTALAEVLKANAVLDEMGRPMANREAYFMVEAAAQAMRGDFEAAIAVCQRYRKVVRAGQVLVCDLYADCFKALAALRAGRANAREHLARAFGAARANRVNIVLRHATSLLAELCAAALREGIEAEYVSALVRHRRLPPPGMECPGWPWPLRIRLLGRFQVERFGEPLANLGKQQKTLQLLQLVIALGGRDVAVERVIESLWPGEGRVGQQQAFDTTLHRLRKLLGSENALRVADRRVSLDEREMWVDTMSLSQRLDAAEAAGPMLSTTGDFAKVAEVMALYRGHFLATTGDEPWVLAARERLWNRVRRMLLAFAGAASRAGESERALRVYHFIADLDPLAEDAFLALMRHFAEGGQKAEALRAYERCAAAMAAELGSTPGTALQALATELRRQP